MKKIFIFKIFDLEIKNNFSDIEYFNNIINSKKYI
jgi:hypothetical protein